jgi:alcohol dehydrogenase class IV
MSHGTLSNSAPVGPFSSSWPIPTVFGAGCIDTLSAVVAQAGGRHVLLVTDTGLVACGLAGRLADNLKAAGIGCTVFDAVQPNPLLAHVADALTQWHAVAADTVVALGGGSVMDSSKVLVAAASSDTDLDTVVSRADEVIVRPLPTFVAVPTTAGTGSESTTAALLKDTAGRKRLMRSTLTRPVRILLDPELTVSVPPGMTAATGFDVVMHALGALGTTLANPIGELFAYDALSRATRHLAAAVEYGNDLHARGEMSYASYLAGLAIAMNGVDAIHGLCTPLESVVNRPHGHVLSVTFGPVMRANLPTMQAQYAHAARLCGYAGLTASDADAAKALYEGLDALRRRLGLPRCLADIGVDDTMLAALPELALASRATQVNRLPLDREDIVSLYAAMA